MRLVLAPWEWAVTDSETGEHGWCKPGGSDNLGLIDLRSNEQAGTPGPIASGFGLFAYETLPVGLVPVADLGDDPLRRMRVAERNALADALGLARAAFPDAPLAAVLAEHIMGAVADPTGRVRVRPVCMDRRGASIHLGGFGRVWHSRLDKAHPLFARSMQTRRADYARERLRLLALWRAKAIARGADPDEAEARALVALRKWNGHDLRQLGVTIDDLVPAQHLADGDLAPATTLTEPWPTNSTTISSGQDNPWTEELGDQEVAAGVLGTNTGGTNCTCSCDTSLSSANHLVRATYALALLHANPLRAAVLARYDATITSDAPTDAYAATADRGGTGERNASKRVAGVFTSLASDATDPGASGSVEIKASGSQISAIIGGTAFQAVTDTSLTGYLQCGVGVRRNGALALSDATVDNVTMTDVLSSLVFDSRPIPHLIGR